MLKYNPIIALDSPTGAGGTSTGKIVAETLNLANFFSAGEFYRAITFHALNKGWAPEEMAARMKEINLELDRNEFYINNTHLDRTRLHDERISSNVQNYSPNKLIRDKIENMIKESVLACEGGVFIEGRPLVHELFVNERDSILGVHLWADSMVRAQRRFAQYQTQGKDESLSDILTNLENRDKSDMERDLGKLLSHEEAKASGLYDLVLRNDDRDAPWTARKIVDAFNVKFPHYRQ